MKKFLVFSLVILFILTGVMIVKSMRAPVTHTALREQEVSLSAAGEGDKETAVEAADEDGDSSGSKADKVSGEPSQEAVPEEAQAAEVTESEEREEEREPLRKYDEILKINPYVAGWLDIEGSSINAPVVYTPRSQNYFLHRSLDGSDAESGTLFIAMIWREGYYNTLIYGHNMKDGTLFGSLGKYAKESYGKSHDRLKFDTLYEEKEYELLGVFYSSIEEEELETKEDRAERDKEIEVESRERKEQEEASEAAAPEESVEKPGEEEGEKPVEKPEEPPPLTLEDLKLNEDPGDVDVYRMEKDSDMEKGRFRYYYFTDLTYEKDYDYFVDNVKKNSLYDTGVDAEWGDELLTLSTCSYQEKNGRLIVVAKRVK